MTRSSDKDVIAKEGHGSILLFAVVMLALFFIYPAAGWMGLALLAFSFYFFRNPKRFPPKDRGVLISPADGRVIYVGRSVEGNSSKREMSCVSIFMSPFDVHVNRSPEDGIVVDKLYQPGKFLAAFSDKACSENERMAVKLKLESGCEIVFVQVAGWLARRIVCYPKVGDSLTRGKIFGLIKYGSRMDIYFPDGYFPQVTKDQRVKAGETIVARWMDERKT